MLLFCLCIICFCALASKIQSVSSTRFFHMIIINGYICIIFRPFLLYHFSYISRTCLSRSALHFIAFLLLHTLFPDYHTKICAYMLLLFANFLISKLLFYVSVEHQHIDINNVRGNNPYIEYITINNNKHLSTNNKQIVKRDYNHLKEYIICDY